MELLDRYLQAVGKHLPWKRQEDIIAELRANLEAQLEDKEAELGRPLNATEVEAWLKELGHPAQMAARYQPPRYVIGPTLYPTFTYVLRIVWLWAAALSLVAGAVQVADHFSAQAVADRLVQIPFTLLVSAAWVTLTFAAIEWASGHWSWNLGPCTPPSAQWSPITLPPLDKNVHGHRPRSYTQAIVEVVFHFLGIIWLLLIPGHPYLMLGPGAYYVDKVPYILAPQWVIFYWWIIALNGTQLAWKIYDLVRFHGPRQHRWLRIAEDALGLIPLAILLAAPGRQLLLLRNSATADAATRAALGPINHAIFLSIVLILAISIVTNAWKFGKAWLENYRKSEAVTP